MKITKITHKTDIRYYAYTDTGDIYTIRIPGYTPNDIFFAPRMMREISWNWLVTVTEIRQNNERELNTIEYADDLEICDSYNFSYDENYNLFNTRTREEYWTTYNALYLTPLI